jgi:predicted RNase H-like HicB family nuclease
MLRFYPALLIQSAGEEPNDGYDVVFPDLPGCTSTGDTLREAAEMAVEAASGHVEVMAEHGEDIPEPSDPAVPLPDWIADAGGRVAARVMVPVELPGRAMRVNITMDEGLLARLDKAANAEGETRSGYIARAVRERLAR